MTKKIVCQIIASIVLISGCVSPTAKKIRIADNILKSKFDPNLSEISDLAKGFRKSDFSPTKLSKYSDTEIGRLYDALFRITFFFPEQDIYLGMQENVLEEKILRRKHINYDVERMHKIYIDSRKFNKASNIRKRFPDIKFLYVPDTIIESINGKIEYRVYDVSHGAEKAILKSINMSKGLKVVMVIFTGCAIAEESMEQIMADLELSALFKKYGVLLTTRFDTKGILLWREHFNFPEIYIVYKASDFPGFDFRTSPSFYFLRDGKVKFSFSGWNKPDEPDSGKNDMWKGMSSIIK